MARDIEGENETLKKENRELLFKVNVLKEEKVLLVGELNQKKMRLKQLMLELYEEGGQQGSSRVSSSPRTSRSKKFSSTLESPLPIPKYAPSDLDSSASHPSENVPPSASNQPPDVALVPKKKIPIKSC